MKVAVIVSMTLAAICCFPDSGNTGEAVGSATISRERETAVSTTHDHFAVKLDPSVKTQAPASVSVGVQPETEKRAKIIVAAYGRDFRSALSKAEAAIALAKPDLAVSIRQDINHDIVTVEVDFTGMTRQQAFAVMSSLAKDALDCKNEVDKKNVEECNEYALREARWTAQSFGDWYHVGLKEKSVNLPRRGAAILYKNILPDQQTAIVQAIEKLDSDLNQYRKPNRSETMLKVLRRD